MGTPQEGGSDRFSGLVLSLGAAALAHLGVPGPAGGAVKIDLAQAQQAIDLLEMLQQKTAGNLTAEEGGLLEGLLFDIRLRYVEAGKTGPAGGPACPTEKK